MVNALMLMEPFDTSELYGSQWTCQAFILILNTHLQPIKLGEDEVELEPINHFVVKHETH